LSTPVPVVPGSKCRVYGVAQDAILGAALLKAWQREAAELEKPSV
jgi:hypothetical protein